MSRLADHPIIQARYFFPRPDTFTATDELVRGIRVRVPVDGAVLDCYHCVPRPEGMTIVHFHGNGEVVADYVDDALVDRLIRRGINVFFAEYRGYGRSTGKPALEGMLDDVPAIVSAVGAPTERVVFMGRSIGSIYAIHAASLFPDAAGLIIESGIASPLERILLRAEPRELGASIEELRAAFAERLDHEAKLRAWTRPTLIMHAHNDHLVRLDNAERIHEWAGGSKTLEVFKRGDHNTIIAHNLDAYARCIESFISLCASEDPGRREGRRRGS